MSDEKVERVVITVDDQHMPSIEAVARDLKMAGMQVSQVMSTVGIITGEVPEAKKRELANVAGVAAVEADEEMHAI